MNRALHRFVMERNNFREPPLTSVGALPATQAAVVLIGMNGKRYLITSPGDQFDKWRFLLKDIQELTSGTLAVIASMTRSRVRVEVEWISR